MEKNQIVAVKNLDDQQIESTSNRQLKSLSDRQLIANIDRLAGEERRITLEVLQHLREIEVRRLFVDLGFDSMYKYCIQRLKYSEGEAQRRLSAARLLRELPEIEAQIKNGDLNMTNLWAVQNFVRAEKIADKALTREEKLELISLVENKSTRQVKNELIRNSHQPALLADKFQMSAASVATPLGFQLTKFEASMTDENLELLQEFKNLYAHDLPDLSNHSTLIFLLQKAVQHKKKKLGLIDKNSNLSDKIPKKSNAPLPLAETVKIEGAKNKNLRQALSNKTKKQVWQRANACCEHVDPKTKTRCSSKFALEADHIVAVGLGGSNKIENLRLLCRAHNSRRAVKTFGSWLQ